MIFIKFTLHILLTICLIGTCESNEYPENKSCGCGAKFNLDISRKGNDNLNASENDGLNEKQSNQKGQSFKNKNSSNQDTTNYDPQEIQDHSSHIISDGKIQLNSPSNPLNNIGAQFFINSDKHLSEAPKFLFHRLDGNNVPQFPQFYHKENNFVNPINDNIHKIYEEHDDELTKSDYLSKDPLREYFNPPKNNYGGDSRDLNTKLHLSDALLKMILSHLLGDISIPQIPLFRQKESILVSKEQPREYFRNSDDYSNAHYNIEHNSDMDKYIDTDLNKKYETDSEPYNKINSDNKIDEIINYSPYNNQLPKHNFPNYYDNYHKTVLPWPQRIQFSEYGDETQQKNLPRYKKTSKNEDLGYINNFNGFDKSIEFVNNENQGSDKTDISHIGHSILRILNKNGIKDKMLMNTYGSVPSKSTLNFTPIMIGNTESLRHLLEGKNGVSSSKLQTPYLQANLVSATHPPKLLGIIFFGTTYLPLSALRDMKNSWRKLEKALKNIFLNMEEKDKFNFDHPKELYYGEGNTKYRPKQSINDISNSGIIDSSEHALKLKKKPSKPGITGTEDDNDYNYSYLETFISPDSENNKESIVMPHIKFRNRPKDTLRQNKSVAVIALKNPESTDIHPDLSSFIDSISTAKNKSVLIKSSLDRAAKNSNVFMTSNVVKELSVPHKTLHEPHLLKNSFGLSTVKKVEPDGFFRNVGSKAKPVLKLIKHRPIGFHSVAQNVLDKEINIERSGVADEPKILKEYGHDDVIRPNSEISQENPHNGNSPFEVIENDDYDDGDFRIIGGGAATGSGTPLSNKGRSGFIF